MKILQLSKFYPPTHGGLEVVAEFFSRAAQELGHRVTVLSVGEESSAYFGKYGERVFQSKVDFSFKSAPLSWGFAKTFKVELLDSKILFVHLPNPFAHLLLRLHMKIIRERGIKVVGIYHSDVINQAFLRDAYDLHFKATIDSYDAFVCSSHNLRRCSSILSGLDPEKVRVIPFCVEVTSAASEREIAPKVNFLSIGRMVPYKGFEFLVDCFRELPYDLTLVGNGPLLEKLKSSASSNVTFTGQVTDEEKEKFFHDHTALVVTSINRAEAYGMTIVEAFGHGLPVIASQIDTGVTFLVRDDETGLTFPVLNKEEFKNQVLRLATDPGLRRKISGNCKRFYSDALSYPAFKENVSHLLNSYEH